MGFDRARGVVVDGLIMFRDIAFSAFPFIDDKVPHSFEHPPIPIFTRDSLVTRPVQIGGSGDAGYICRDYIAVIDPRYGPWFEALQFGFPNLNYGVEFSDWINEASEYACEVVSTSNPPIRERNFTRPIFAKTKVAPQILRVVRYELDGDYFKPVSYGLIQAASSTRQLIDFLSISAALFAVVTTAGALSAAITAGQTIQVGQLLKLVSALDRLPGVDFGDASDVIKYGSRILNAGAPGGLVSSLTEPAGDSTMFDYEMPDFGQSWTDIALPNPDDFGGFDFGGIGSGLIDTGAGFEIPSFDVGLDSLTQGAGGVFGSVDFSKLLTDLAGLYVQYRIADQAIEARGGAVPAATRPTAGTTRTLADGTTIRVNNDGSSTITRPDGSSATVTTSGQVVGQTPPRAAGASAPLLPGVSNQTLLIGGALALGALLLLRKG